MTEAEKRVIEAALALRCASIYDVDDRASDLYEACQLLELERSWPNLRHLYHHLARAASFAVDLGHADDAAVDRIIKRWESRANA